MHRIYRSGTVSWQPSPPENPSFGYPHHLTYTSNTNFIEQTKVGVWTFHMITEELCNLAEKLDIDHVHGCYDNIIKLRSEIAKKQNTWLRGQNINFRYLFPKSTLDFNTKLANNFLIELETDLQFNYDPSQLNNAYQSGLIVFRQKTENNKIVFDANIYSIDGDSIEINSSGITIVSYIAMPDGIFLSLYEHDALSFNFPEVFTITIDNDLENLNIYEKCRELNIPASIKIIKLNILPGITVKTTQPFTYACTTDDKFSNDTILYIENRGTILSEHKTSPALRIITPTVLENYGIIQGNIAIDGITNLNIEKEGSILGNKI